MYKGHTASRVRVSHAAIAPSSVWLPLAMSSVIVSSPASVSALTLSAWAKKRSNGVSSLLGIPDRSFLEDWEVSAVLASAVAFSVQDDAALAGAVLVNVLDALYRGQHPRNKNHLPPIQSVAARIQLLQKMLLCRTADLFTHSSASSWVGPPGDHPPRRRPRAPA